MKAGGGSLRSLQIYNQGVGMSGEGESGRGRISSKKEWRSVSDPARATPALSRWWHLQMVFLPTRPVLNAVLQRRGLPTFDHVSVSVKKKKKVGSPGWLYQWSGQLLISGS